MVFIDKKSKEISCLNDKLGQNKKVTTSPIINLQKELTASVVGNTNHNLLSTPPSPRQTSENYLIVTDVFGSISIENNSSNLSPILPVINSIASTADSSPNKSSKIRITTAKNVA